MTRGQHFHHSKSEKFIIIKGEARFRFRHLITNEKHEIITSSKKLEIVETIPGWVHDITNIGKNEMIAMLWANEIFDRNDPDTISSEV
jgi:UDP-2-acetamido-2,6-beta-L-arabino-hexul-4-ose reductase